MRYSPLLFLILFSVLSFSYASTSTQTTPTHICDIEPTHPNCPQENLAGYDFSDSVPDFCLNNPHPDCQAAKNTPEECHALGSAYIAEIQRCGKPLTPMQVVDYCKNNLLNPFCSTKIIEHCKNNNADPLCYSVVPEDSSQPIQPKDPNRWQRILEDIAGGVGTAAVLGIAAFLGALLLPPVRKKLSKLFRKQSTVESAEDETKEPLYP